MTDQAPTPETAAAASVPDALPLNELALIGVFEGPEGATALIRLATGEIVKVAPGTMIGPSQVVAIGDGAMVLARGSETSRLTLPAMG